MKILLSTAELSEVQWATEMGILDGVLTSPVSLFDREGRSERDVLRAMCDVSDASVFASVRSISSQEIYRDAKELSRISDQIVVQVPFVEDAVSAIRRLQLEGVRVAATLVFTAAQAILAARAGASAILVAVDEAGAMGSSGATLLAELRAVLDGAGAEVDLIAVRPDDASQFAACAHARADGIAVTPDLLRRLLVNPMTDRGLDQFLRDISHHHHNAWSGQS